MLIAIIGGTSIYALQNSSTEMNDYQAKEIATAFITNAQTFHFDGLESSIKIVNVVELESNPIQYIVTLEFKCTHIGYGDRTNENLAEVITLHTAKIKIISGKVRSATIDNFWDELNQKSLQLTKNDIEQIALDWLLDSPTFKFDGVSASLKIVESWQAQTFAAPSFWQVTIEFDSSHPGFGDREGQILAQVVTHHVIRIHVTEGKISMAVIDEKWDELNQKPIPSNHTEEEAVQIALNYLYNCPTFKFDGISETVKVQKTMALRMPNTWEVYISFTCGYPGYGDRTGYVTYGHSQNHFIRITVSEGVVGMAFIDEIWDELNQKMLVQPS